MAGTVPRHMLTKRVPPASHFGFTLFEVLIVVAIVAILGGIGVGTNLNWRAAALNREAVAAVERVIADGRQEAKRLTAISELTFGSLDDPVVLTVGEDVRSVTLPSNTRVLREDGTVGQVTVSYDGQYAVQAPFEPVRILVVTGQGLMRRQATLTLVPPLGYVAVVRP